MRYFAANVVERLTDSEEAVLSTFADRNDLVHRYELYEAVSDRTLRSCISYFEEYLLMCRQIYACCQPKGMLPQADEKGNL